MVSTIELARIGFNDITQRYPIDSEQRMARHKALLESVLYTFIQPNGAMRSTQHPHLVDFRGVISLSSQLVPAPTLSPLNTDYLPELEQITGQLNRIRPGALALRPFKSLAEFTTIMSDLIEDSSPYALTYPA